MELKTLSEFPKDFLWGAAISSFQAEGNWKKDGQGPSVIDQTRKEDNTTSFDDGVDFYHRYHDDIRLMKELGLKAFRLSISWTRVFPTGNGKPNLAGIEFYKNVIHELKQNGIEPIVTIYHFDYPTQLVEQYGGWISRKSIQDYENYATYLFKELGDEVKYWITINEQDHVVKMPERLGIGDGKADFSDHKQEAYVANHNMCVASARVIAKCHQLLPNAKIGPALSYQAYYPATDQPEDVLAADDLATLTQNYILDLQCRGHYNPIFKKYLVDRGIFPDFPTTDLELLKENRPDFIGINYYSTDDVSSLSAQQKFGKTEGLPVPNKEYGIYAKTKNRTLPTTKWGWTIDSVGLRIALQRLYHDYELPILITENGFSNEESLEKHDGVTTVSDLKRISYLHDHIKAVHEVISSGIPVLGYCVWTLMDVISGHSGMNKRYGLIYVDRDNDDLKQLKRIKKASFYWYQSVIKANTEEVGEDGIE